MPTHDETDRLGIQRGTPVAEHRRVGYTAEDRPVRLMISVPGDTIALRYVVVT
jgi:DNA-binding GntR family transcriptional regulator